MSNFFLILLLKRPRSMVSEKNAQNTKLHNNTWSAVNHGNISNDTSAESSEKSSQSTDVNNNEQKSDPKSQSNLSTFSPIINNSQSSSNQQVI